MSCATFSIWVAKVGIIPQRRLVPKVGAETYSGGRYDLNGSMGPSTFPALVSFRQEAHPHTVGRYH